ncbi:MAG: hypothetical protein ACUVXJ_01575 [Phycisphaerae bacterium]
MSNARYVLFGAVIACWALSLAQGATFTIDFSESKYGQPNEACVNNPSPPVFNRPEYGNQTAAYIVDPAACGQGNCSPDPNERGSDSLLTQFFYNGTLNSNEVRFTWAAPANDDSWLRLTTFNYTSGNVSVTPVTPSPTVYLGVGGKISMDIMVYGTAGDEDVQYCLPKGPAAAQLEFSLWIRETGKNLPLGMDGGTSGAVELVGCDSMGGTVDTATPVGGAAIVNDEAWHTVTWEFVDAGGGQVGVQVSVDGGVPVAKGIFGVTGDGILLANHNRGTLDSLAIRKKPGDSTTIKWFINIDNIVIDAPGITDPVYIVAPVSNLHTSVTVQNVAATASEVRLYRDNGGGPALLASATQPPEDFGDGEHVFSGLVLAEDDILTATQVVNGIESEPSDPIQVLGGLPIDDFSGTIREVGCTVPPTLGGWTDVRDDAYAEARTTTLDGSQAMWLYDGGWRNGMYRIYESVIPTTGDYHVTVLMHITEDATDTNAIRQYQIGVVAAGTRTSCSAALNAINKNLPNQAIGKYQGLTSADNSGLPTQKVITDVFTANAGDNLMIVFSTNVEAPQKGPFGWLPPGTFNEYIAGWTDPDGYTYQTTYTTSFTWHANARVRVDNIILKPGPPPNCTLTPAVSVPGPLWAGQTTVTVTNVLNTATEVRVYKAGYTQIGRKVLTSPSTGTEVVTVEPLVQGNIISATQTVNGIEGCQTVVGATVGPECGRTPAVSVQPPLISTQALVYVTGVSVSPAATEVRVYDGTNQIGANTAPGGLATVPVTVTPLVAGHTIKATQVVDGIESCLNTAPGLVVDSCNQVPAVNVVGPVNAGATQVTVGGVTDSTAEVTVSAVTVYADGAQIGQKTSGIVAGNNVVDVTPLVKGKNITATQTITTAYGSLEGCKPTTDEMVGSGGNSQVLVSLGVRFTNPTGEIGENGGITGALTWLVQTATAGAPPIGKPLAPLPVWQTLTFDPVNDAKTPFTGAWPSPAPAKAVLEELAFTIDQAAPNVGPYMIYIDNITSGGVNFADFESIPAGQQAVFRQPSYSGSTSGNLAAAPNRSVVDGTVGYGGGQSCRVEWAFKDEALTRWLRLTTNDTPNIPNPIIDLTQPITMQVLFLPLGAEPCNDPFADVDDDGDVDQADFAVMQRCIGLPLPPSEGEDPVPLPAECFCFDRAHDGDVDSDDVGFFEACASGAGIAADPDCD